MELLAIGYKLATQGVLGTDMYAGFFGADQHHLHTLPLQHVLEALAFRVLGPGVLQARLVSVAAAVSVVWSVGWLAFRWYGLLAAVVCELLLVGWPSDLTAAPDGLPLLGVARAARYDVLAVACAWLAIAALDSFVTSGRRRYAFATGVFAGLAALSTFFGAFVLAATGLGWWWTRRARGFIWAAVGAAVVVLPWAAYSARYGSDLLGQLSVYGAARGDFLRPGFYLENLLSEPTRFSHLWPLDQAARPWSGALLLVGFLPSLAYAARRATSGDRLLLATIVAFGGGLALVDQTKVPLYTILLLPSACLALGALLAATLAWSARLARQPAAIARISAAFVAAVATVPLAFVGAEGVSAYRLDWAEGSQVSSYADLGRSLATTVEPGAVLLGPERWWWPLREHRYISLRSLWFQWAAPGATPTTFADLVARHRPDNLIVNVNIRNDVQAFPVELQAEFWDYVTRCTRATTSLDDETYGVIEVYAVVGC